jgi:hypothetical protein
VRYAPVAKQLFSEQHERERFLFLVNEFRSNFFVTVKPMSNLIVQTPLEKQPPKIKPSGQVAVQPEESRKAAMAANDSCCLNM